MAIRDENDNKVTPLIPRTNDDEVIKTAIWKMDVENVMSKIDHGRYEHCSLGKAGKIYFTETVQTLVNECGKHNVMIFIKPPVEQPYNYVGKDTCENASFAVVVAKHKAYNDTGALDHYSVALFGSRDGLPVHSEAGVLIDAKVELLVCDYLVFDKNQRSKELKKYINDLISNNEYRLFESVGKVEAPDCIKIYMKMTGATEKQACQELMHQLNDWPEGVRSYDELLNEVFHKVAAEQSRHINPTDDFLSHVNEYLVDDEYLDLLVAKEHWLDMKAANEKGLLYPSGPFSGMIQPGECVDPDEMLAMIDTELNKITDSVRTPKITTKPLRNQSERGER